MYSTNVLQITLYFSKKAPVSYKMKIQYLTVFFGLF